MGRWADCKVAGWGVATYVRGGGAAGLPGGRGLLCEEERKVVAGVKVGAPSPSLVVVVLGALCSKLLEMGLS